MKFFALALGAVVAKKMTVQEQINLMTTDDKLHFFEFDNAKMLWHNDWEAYRDAREAVEHDCKLAESDNYLGAQ